MTQSTKINFVTTEKVVLKSSVKKVFLEISQNSQENICARDYISKNTFNRTPPVASSENILIHDYDVLIDITFSPPSQSQNNSDRAVTEVFLVTPMKSSLTLKVIMK